MSARKMNRITDMLPGRIKKTVRQSVSLPKDFIEVVRPFAHLPGTVALMSGGNLDSARYHIMGIAPLFTLSTKHHTVTIEINGQSNCVQANPFDALQQVLQQYQMPNHQAALPLESGLMGYLSYDLKDALETLPATSIDDLQLPDMYMTLPSLLVIRDRKDHADFICAPLVEGECDDVATERIAQFRKALHSTPPPAAAGAVAASPFQSRFKPHTYMNAIDTIRNYIADGDVYQVNMSQRFAAQMEGDPFELYARMYRENPAPFFAYIHAGDHQVLSTSPERFIEMRRNEPTRAADADAHHHIHVETRPIKGTRPRGNSAVQDAAMKDALLESQKDDAELSMIVDLLRNDIGKVCATGSVRVKEHKRLESYENVHHLVSIVTGILDAGKDAVDLIRAIFPGGSITGCPKIRAMEIIDELEPVRRHIYTGSIGYLSFHNTMDLSIAIRTATVVRNKIVFSVGGGIVFGSIAADEYQETLDKGKTLMCAISPRPPQPETPDAYVWCNGLIQPAKDTAVSVYDEGFLYGYGFFETIRIDRGEPMMLDSHMKRFARAWETCFTGAPPDLTWKKIIAQVIDKNQLGNQVAAVKILAAAKNGDDVAPPCTLLVTARPYRHRLENTAAKGLKLAVYPHRRHTPLASHKTMNYMFYKMAGKWAATMGADEALICNVNGTLSETNTANIFFKHDNQWLFPASDFFLEGTCQVGVKQLLTKWNETFRTKPITIEDARHADAAFISNALMGVVSVIAVDDINFEPNTEWCTRFNHGLFGDGKWETCE